MAGQFDLSLDIPSECARKLKAGEVDLALTPVAIIPELEQGYLVSDYCIGAVGAVNTVCVFSEVPLQDIKHLFLDFHSRSSVALTRFALCGIWNITPN
jgi:chorismate dehydratase